MASGASMPPIGKARGQVRQKPFVDGGHVDRAVDDTWLDMNASNGAELSAHGRH